MESDEYWKSLSDRDHVKELLIIVERLNRSFNKSILDLKQVVDDES